MADANPPASVANPSQEPEDDVDNDIRITLDLVAITAAQEDTRKLVTALQKEVFELRRALEASEEAADRRQVAFTILLADDRAQTREILEVVQSIQLALDSSNSQNAARDSETAKAIQSLKQAVDKCEQTSERMVKLYALQGHRVTSHAITQTDSNLLGSVSQQTTRQSAMPAGSSGRDGGPNTDHKVTSEGKSKDCPPSTAGTKRLSSDANSPEKWGSKRRASVQHGEESDEESKARAKAYREAEDEFRASLRRRY